jgi:hypothetical protein
LEHTTNPQYSFLKLRPYLKNGGGCIVSLPNVAFGDIKISLLQDDFTYTDMGIMDKTHLRFFTHKTIADFFSNINFEVVECRAKVADITKPSEDIPSRVKSFIKKDPHSYIYQYILKVRASNLSQELLMKNNNSKLNLTFSDINKELKIIQKNRLINKFLPIGSKQREVAKSLYASLKKRK